MAEAVVFSLAAAVLKGLATEMGKPGGSFISQKIRLLCCAEDELGSLHLTVKAIQAVLLDAERQQWHSQSHSQSHSQLVKLWLKNVKDVLYDVQDLLDDVATEDLRWKVTPGCKISKEVRLFFSESNQLAHGLKVGNEIQRLGKELIRIEKIRNFSLEKHHSEATLPTTERITPTFDCEKNIIDREKDKEEIIVHLLDSSSEDSVSVVSILSIGGMGKTTLADLVFKDEKVKECFKLRMWVCHGDPKIFNADLMVKKILNSAKADPEVKKNLEDIENKSSIELRWLLRKVLGGKKYLLVLDDLWNENRMTWLELQPLLMDGSRGSKILITTRDLSVVKATDKKSVVYNLRGLSPDGSWDLFKKMTETTFDSGLEEIGRGIVKKCHGVPLAIKTIGSLLYTTEKKEWLNFKECELSNIDDSEKGIMEVLKLSYDHLSLHLKHCFAYCALFPKDYVFDKQTIIQLWMAQGFIESSKQSDDIEEKGDNYVSNLLCRSFLEVEEINDHTGEVNTFKMHDLMHDLALKVAGDECKMIDLMHDLALKVAGDECKMIDLNEGGIKGIRHASFASQSSSLQKVTSLLEATNLRTFLSLKEWSTSGLTYFPNEHCDIISKFRCCRALGFGYEDFLIPSSLGSRLKHLRFLDISNNSSIQNLPNSIMDLVNLQTLKLSNCKNLTTLPRDLKKLVNLRFLDISGNLSIQNLPDSITDLVNLQTLELSNCQKLTTVPRDLKKLVNLRHLLIDGCDSLSHMPCGLNHLSKLQTLCLFIVQKMDLKVPGGVGSLDELAGLNRLAGSIALKNLQFLHPVSNEGHLKEKQGLRCLELSWSTEQQDGKSNSDELSLWEYLRPHPNLTCLRIDSCLNRSPPSWLSSITNLIELTLYSCREWKYLPSLREFSSLRRLTLKNLDALEFVEEISDMEQSDTSPPCLPSLEQLDLSQCRNLKGWWGRRQPMEPDQDHQQYNSYSSFPKLLSMMISNCPHLNSMPLFPQIKKLMLRRVSTKWLQQGMAISTFIPLSNLERLTFRNMDLEHSTLETLLPFLRNLESLTFSCCDKLRSLSHGMQSLSSLQHLDIYGCEELDVSSHDDEHGTQWRSLAKLRYLTFYQLPELVALPEGIQHITTLESLDIGQCENLMSLPEWIGNFSTLQDLDISGCSKLMCLPDGISRLTSLNTLRIIKCPVLQERCQRESGADWEKIARLPCSREGIIVE